MASKAASHSLEEWFSDYAPLTDAQRLSVSELSAFISDDAESFAANTIAHDDADLEPDSTPQSSLFCWMASKARGRELASRTNYEPMIEALRTSMKEVGALMDGVCKAQNCMSQLRAGLAYVQDNSSELMKHASTMVQEQTNLEHLHEQIMQRLQDFSVLSQTAPMLSDTADIQSPEFFGAVEHLCLALQSMDAHMHYKDAHVYRIRIENAFVRAMTLVKLAFQRAGTKLVQDAPLNEIDARDPSSQDVQRVMYAPFHVLHEKFHVHLETLAQQAPSSEDVREMQREYDQLWMQWRVSLVHEYFSRTLNQLQDVDALLQRLECAVDVAQALYVYEKKLYLYVFSRKTTEAVSHIMENTGEQLARWLSSRINASSTMDELMHLCTTTRKYPDSAWWEPVVRDLSVRLEKSALLQIKDKVAAFKPSADDLDYRARLSFEDQNRHDTWYAPVQMVYDMLHLLHAHMSPKNFIHVSLRAIEASEVKVQEASHSMQDGKFGGDDGDVLDALLFAWRHYSVLRELLSLAEKRCESKTSFSTGLTLAMQSVWTVASVATVSSDFDALRDKCTHLDMLMERTVQDAGRFLCASLTLPLQIYEQQTAKSPSKGLAAWHTFQQSLDVNLDLAKGKIHAYVPANDLPTLIQATLTPLHTAYNAFITGLPLLLGSDPDDVAAAQQLRSLPTADKLQAQLAQRFKSL